MKKLLLLMLVTMTTFHIYAYTTFYYTYEGQTLYYNDNNSGSRVEVSAPEETQGDVIIPSTVEYQGTIYEVTAISSFQRCTGLTSVKIPDSVTEIRSYAFYGCTALTSVTIPNSVTEIRDDTFTGCSGLTSITIPDSVTEIKQSAFYGCSGLTSISIGSAVTKIGYAAFDGCTELTSVSIPGSVKDIYASAFGNCAKLESVVFEESDEILIITNTYEYHYMNDHRVVNGAFNQCVSLQKVEVNRCLELESRNNTMLKNSILWENGLFAETPLHELILGKGCHVISEMEFKGSSALENLTIPSNISLIMPNAFEDCTNLKNVTFEESSEPLFMVGDFGQSGIEVLNLNRQLFEGTIEVEGFGTYMCKPTFAGCAGLTSINFGENFTSICNNMFSGSTALRSVTIPPFLSKIGEGAFSGCMNLKSINIEDSDNPILINSKTNSDGEGSTFAGAPLETLYLGRNVEFSGTELSPFKNKTLLTTLTIGNKTTAINNYLFYGCTNISMLSVPSSVKTIGDYAFYDCNQSRSLTISKSVESIGEYAFYNCKNLKNLTIPGSVVTIGDYAFRSCSNLTNIKIGEKVETIGNYAFLDCYSAETITLGNSVRTIGNNAFYNCQAWINITIPNSVETIGNDAFALCLGASEITIGEGVETIGLRSFTDCENLTTLTIGKSVKEIGEMAFFNCESLKDVYVEAPTPPMANESVFSDYAATLHVPEGTSSIYKSSSDTCWPLFTSVGEYVPVDTGVEEILGNQDDNSVIEIYDLSGHSLGSSTESLAPGIYIVRQGRKTKKVML